MVKYRVFVIKENADTSRLMEKIGENSVSFRKLNLYGRTIVLIWPDPPTPITDSSIAYEAAIDGDYVLSTREWKKDNTTITVDGATIGEGFVIAAGPCSIDFDSDVEDFARSLKKAGADIIRGGAFKPRTSPFSFQGKGKQGIYILKKMKEASGLPTVSEILDPEDINSFGDVDILQIGSRNAQNFQLLRKASRAGKPVLLKRGMGNTYSEWLATADYVMEQGNGSVILCERGIRTFENSTRFTLDVGSIAKAKRESHLPVCSDPSHAAGTREMVLPLALSSIAAGSDMLLVEVHPNPTHALSDAKQQITVESLAELSKQARSLVKLLRG